MDQERHKSSPKCRKFQSGFSKNLDSEPASGEYNSKSAQLYPLDQPDSYQKYYSQKESITPLESTITSQAHCAKASSLFHKAFAEVISTFILVFVGCGSAMVDKSVHGHLTSVGVAVIFGLVVLMMIYSVGHISGAHMNPAVTLAFASMQDIPWKEVPVYIVAQVTASICASMALREILKPDEIMASVTYPAGGILRSFALEILLTYILMFVVTAVSNNPSAKDLSGVTVACTVTVNSLFGGPISGASMNPARTLGPAIASNTYKGIWIYILGPALGALGGAWSFKLLSNPIATSTPVFTHHTSPFDKKTEEAPFV